MQRRPVGLDLVGCDVNLLVVTGHDLGEEREPRDRHARARGQPVGGSEPVGDLVLRDVDPDPVHNNEEDDEDDEGYQQLSHRAATLPTGGRATAGARRPEGGRTSMTAPSSSRTVSAGRLPACFPSTRNEDRASTAGTRRPPGAAPPPPPAPRRAWRRRVSPRPPRRHASPQPSSAQLPLARRISSLTSAPGGAALGPFGRSMVEGLLHTR